MSKRSIKKVRHYAPAPSIKKRVAAGKAGVNLIDKWKKNVPRLNQINPYLEIQEENNE